MRLRSAILFVAVAAIPAGARADCLGSTLPGGPCYAGPGAAQVPTPSGPAYLTAKPPGEDDNAPMMPVGPALACIKVTDATPTSLEQATATGGADGSGLCQ